MHHFTVTLQAITGLSSTTSVILTLRNVTDDLSVRVYSLLLLMKSRWLIIISYIVYHIQLRQRDDPLMNPLLTAYRNRRGRRDLAACHWQLQSRESAIDHSSKQMVSILCLIIHEVLHHKHCFSCSFSCLRLARGCQTSFSGFSVRRFSQHIYGRVIVTKNSSLTP